MFGNQWRLLFINVQKNGASEEIRTLDINLGKVDSYSCKSWCLRCCKLVKIDSGSLVSYF